MKPAARVCVVALAAAALVLAFAPAAFAYKETTSTYIPSDGFGSCGFCHYPNWTGNSAGPHRGYTTATRACKTCHTLHVAPSPLKLLPAATIEGTCEVCHDGTGGRGLYGTIKARGLNVGADHSTESTTVVPGGNATNGGALAMAFRGGGGTLTCTDCHSPHGKDLVTAFLGERQREPQFDQLPVYVSARLLRRKPAATAAAVNEYGSDWCLTCHAGRASGLPGVMNHPVESLLTTTSPYNYRVAAIVGPGPYPTSVTVTGPAGIDTDVPGYNRAYLWPYPRTGAQKDRKPICQQCHEDTRDVGTLTAAGNEASPTVAQLTGYPAGDGYGVNDNPRFQNFPHETTGFRLLVEATATATTDDLCTNCHPPVALP